MLSPSTVSQSRSKGSADDQVTAASSSVFSKLKIKIPEQPNSEQQDEGGNNKIPPSLHRDRQQRYQEQSSKKIDEVQDDLITGIAFREEATGQMFSNQSNIIAPSVVPNMEIKGQLNSLTEKIVLLDAKIQAIVEFLKVPPPTHPHTDNSQVFTKDPKNDEDVDCPIPT